ncbi:MAG: S49 family peptidase, partial [candidate division KSB1 bacterium]|nr:S49 family peptidase [candidate division KSB1 bacterium]
MKPFNLFHAVIGFVVILVTSLQGQTYIPYYHQQADFLLTSPGALGNGLLGYINPAVLNYVHGPDLRFLFSDEQAKSASLKRWGLFTGIPHLGFGVIRHQFPVGNNQQEVRISDYRIAFGAGSQALSFGLGYGWSRGNLDYVSRDELFTVGTLARPFRQLSVGLSGSFARHHNDREGILDLAVRPLGTDLVTLFSDFSWQTEDRARDAHWSVGAVLQPLPGIHVTGRYFDTEAFTVGLSVSFGKAAFSAQPHFDNQQQLGYTTYGIRLGAEEHSAISRQLKRDRYYLSLNLKGKITYRKYRLFDRDTHTLADILSTLKGAIDDPGVKGVAVNLSGMNITRELAWEIREQLLKVRQAGKHVIIYLDEGGLTEYHLASVADRVILDPDGMILLQGYVLGRTYLRGTLEKLGLGFDEWRFFQYKSAYETFSRDRMSEADREQRQALIDDFYALVRQDVCQSRNFTETKFDSLVNEGFIFLANNALREGLVDTLGRWVDIEKHIESFEGKKKGLIQSGALADKVLPRRDWGARPQIAVVYGLGVCDMDVGINARRLEKIFQRLAKTSRIKAVVFRVDSPGGEVLASDLVAEAMRQCAEKKPVIVSQGNVAGSGGYWISMNADTIVTGPNTITGSIGVIGGWFWNKGFGDKAGMTSDHVKVGNHADLGFGITLPLLGLQLPERNLTSEERSKVELLIKNVYQEFVAKVARGRGMGVE